MTEQDDNEVDQFAEVVIPLPKVSTLLRPVLAVVPCSCSPAEIATLLGNDVDQPRNLAKSVTVE